MKLDHGEPGRLPYILEQPGQPVGRELAWGEALAWVPASNPTAV